MFLRRFSSFFPPLKALANLKKSDTEILAKVLRAAINDQHSYDTIMNHAKHHENIGDAITQIAAGVKNPAIEKFLNGRDAHIRHAQLPDFSAFARLTNRND